MLRCFVVRRGGREGEYIVCRCEGREGSTGFIWPGRYPQEINNDGIVLALAPAHVLHAAFARRLYHTLIFFSIERR